MKLAPLLLTVSVAANVALAAAFFLRSATSHPTTQTATAPGATSVAATASARANALRAAFASGDAAALTAAGVPADVVRELALGRAFARFGERIRAAQASNTADGRWWRNRPSAWGNREDIMLARRELSEAMLAAFGDDLGIGGTDNAQLAFLPPAKRDALRRITQDYDEMMAKYGARGGVQLDSDREKLRLLRAERDRDIAALLTPEELASYEMRTSPTAASLRNRYGDAIQSEEDFQKIYALQKAFDDKFPLDSLNGRVSPELLRQRAEAQRQLQDDLRQALGDDRYAALRRASDFDLRTIEGLVARLNLPANTTDRVASSRESYAAESQRINADSTVPITQRRTQIQELGNRAKADLSQTLGAEAATAYSQRSPWVSMLQNGLAFSTNPKDSPAGAGGPGGQSIFPVMPAGASGGSAVRQVFNIVSGDGGSGTSGAGPVIFSGAAPGHVDSRQFNYVVTSSQTTEQPPPPPPAPPPAPKP